MRPNAACVPGNPARQGVRRILTALALALAVFVFSARPVLAQDSSSEKSLLDKWLALFGQVEVHLVYTDADGKQQDVSLAQAPPDLLKKLPLRLQLESKLPILQPKVSYSDGLWLLYRDGICKDTIPDIQQIYPAGASNTAYDVSCRPFKFGFMQASIVPNAPDYFPQYNKMGVEIIPAGGYPTNTVQQLDIEFYAPANAVSYTLTTSCTCHSSKAYCNADPQFTIPYSVHILVRANSLQQDYLYFGPNPMMQTGYLVEGNGTLMMGGDAYGRQAALVESQLEASLEESLTMLAMTDGASIFNLIEKLFEDIFKYGFGGLVEMTCINNVYNPVVDLYSAPTFNSATAQKMANEAHQAFKTLLLALDSGYDVGFSKLDLVEGKGNGLHFKLTDTPAKPGLQNAIAAANAEKNPASNGIHLVTPSIGTGGQQVKPGVPFLVSGSNFAASYSDRLIVTWGRTLAVAGKSTLQWGPKGGTMQTVPLPLPNDYSTPSFSTPANLKPSTAYQFRVQECDTIACSPWSDWFETSTQSSSGGNVKLWLDNDTAHSIGTGVPSLAGGFEAQVTIPAGTAAGSHTINAAIKGDTPEASVQVTVAGAGGPSATISVMNTATDALKPPVNLAYPTTFLLRGDGFAPSVTVTVYVDTTAGAKLGTAVPNAAGSFLGNFRLSDGAPGSHKLVAIQANGGSTIQASVAVNFMSQPQ